jgi:hypothetical protein
MTKKDVVLFWILQVKDILVVYQDLADDRALCLELFERWQRFALLGVCLGSQAEAGEQASGNLPCEHLASYRSAHAASTGHQLKSSES